MGSFWLQAPARIDPISQTTEPFRPSAALSSWPVPPNGKQVPDDAPTFGSIEDVKRFESEYFDGPVTSSVFRKMAEAYQVVLRAETSFGLLVELPQTSKAGTSRCRVYSGLFFATRVGAEPILS